MGGHYFKPIRNRGSSNRARLQSDVKELLTLLSICVIEPFVRLTDNNALAIPLDLTTATDPEDPIANPAHPVCAAYASSDYCRESWQYHLAELARRPQSHWHRCDYDRLCAIVPVVYRNRCLAAVKLACPASMPEGDFESHVELLDSLVEGFVMAHRDLLSRMAHERAISGAARPSSRDDDGTRNQHPTHPQVLRAIDYINKHLSDPKLTVGAIARELDIDSSYLGNLFADQMGQRMSWFIASQRVELAKDLLATTHRQVKAIALQTGHANPNWFCHIFRVHTGLTPNGYRRQSRQQPRISSDS